MAKPARNAVNEIMRYFQQHPHAADSLEGVARWRLLQQRIDDTVAETHEALEWLVRRRVIERVDVPSGAPLYRLREGNES